MKAKPKHLHPAAIIVFLTQVVKDWWILLVLAIANRLWWWLLLAACIVLVIEILHYVTFTYAIDEHEIVIKRGLINKKQTHLTYPKIQTFQTKQWFFMKPLGLVNLKVASSAQADKQAEVNLPVISMREVKQLEKLKQNATSNENSSEKILDIDKVEQHEQIGQRYQIKWRDLNLYALTSFSIVPILLGLGFIYNRLDDMLPDGVMDGMIKNFSQQTEQVIFWDIIILIVLAAFASYCFIVQRYYHFKTTTYDEQLTMQKGFFQTDKVTVRLNRIQSVVFEQSWLRHLLHLTTIQALVAANASDNEQSGNVVVIPVVQNKASHKIAHRFVKWLSVENVKPTEWLQASRRGKWAIIRNTGLPALVISIGICIFWWPYGVGSFILLPLAWSLGSYAGRTTGVGILHQDMLRIQIGHFFGKKTYYLPKKNIQSCQIKQSIFMQRTTLAHLIINVRNGNVETSLKIRYLPRQDAHKIYSWFAE